MIGQHFDHIWTYIKHLSEIHNLDNSLVNKFAPKIIEGTKRLKAWVESN